MKVAELIVELQKLNPNAEVVMEGDSSGDGYNKEVRAVVKGWKSRRYPFTLTCRPAYAKQLKKPKKVAVLL